MNAGSLFSGIGGLDHGLANAGFRHVFFCESDPWRRSILSRHWPGVLCYEDVRDVGVQLADGRRYEDGTAERTHRLTTEVTADGGVDLLCGGFPCQDVSIAGRRAGLVGERSGLFFEFARIIDTVRPRWVLVENVPGLLSSNDGRDFGVVLGTLADLGYGVGYRVLNSQFFGVPQRRRRVYIVATNADSDPRRSSERAGAVLAVGTRCERHSRQGAEGAEDDTDGAPACVGATVRRLTPTECERLQGLPDGWTLPGPDSRRYAALGDAVTATVSEWIGRRIVQSTTLPG